jgi:hypothetical protein
MVNLFIGILLLCSTFGFTISKFSITPSFRKNVRQHIKPLCIDREFIKA